MTHNKISHSGSSISVACAAVLLAVMAGLWPVTSESAVTSREDFISNFYTGVLERPPESAGSAQWSAFLSANCNAQGFDGIAQGFFDSQEFRTTRPLSLTGLVTLLYRTFLGRGPDPGGLAGWADLIRQARLTMALHGFIPSAEFQSLLPDRTNRAAVTAVVTRLYQQVLGRNPEPAGLQAWVDFIVTTRNLEAAATGFLVSQELESHALTFRGYVTILYRTFLGRDPEPAGLDAWEGVLRNTLLMVINAGFVPSPEFQGLATALCPGSQVSSISLASLSQSQGTPGSAVTMTASGFDPAGEIFVRFFDNRGFDVEVRADGSAATSVTVGVPPYFDVQTRQFTASPSAVNVQLVQTVGTGRVASNALGGFQIGPLPTTGAATGTITLRWIDRMIQETQEAIRRLDAMRQLFPQATSHASLRNTLSTELTALTGIRNDVARIIGGGTSAVTFGRIAGNPVQLDMAALSLIDRFFTAQLQAVPTPVSASVKAALSVPFQIQPSSKSTKPLAIAAFATDPIATSFDELFANIREGIRGNRDAMTRVGGDLMAVGGLIALIPGAEAPGLALAGLGALTWFVGLHANTAILLSLDIGTAETLGGRTGYENTIQDSTAYLSEVATNGAAFVAGALNETTDTFLDLRTVGTELVNLTQTYLGNTQQDFESGRIPPAGATDLPNTQQSCCVINGGCPGETGSQCALNCCCCGPGMACDPSNTTNGCIFVGF